MKKSYVVEVLFTIVLFTIFVVGSSFILLYGVNAYQSLLNQKQDEEEVRLALEYISTRVHSAPSSDSVSLSVIENTTCLTIDEEINDKTYTTAIYWKDGELYEVFLEKSKMSLESGSKITDVASLTMKEENGLLLFVAESNSGTSQSLVLSPR